MNTVLMIIAGIVVIGIVIYLIFSKESNTALLCSYFMLICGVVIGALMIEEGHECPISAEEYLKGQVEVKYIGIMKDSTFVITDTILERK